MFTVYNGNDPGSTLVSNLFIDNYMKDANDAQLKVYLYLLRMMNAGLTTSISDMAVRFNHTERDIARSLRYWEDRGLVMLEYGGNGEISALHIVSPRKDNAAQAYQAPSLPRLQPMAIPSQYTAPSLFTGPSAPAAPAQDTVAAAPAQFTAPAAPAQDTSSAAPAQFTAPVASSQFTAPAASSQFTAPAASAQFTAPAASAQNAASARETAVSGGRASAEAAVPDSSSRKPDAASVEAFRSSAKRAQLLFVIEQYIGKPLAPNEVESVYYISEQLHFSDALIDYLLQYCIDRGKKDFRYIEKVAVNWAEHGITTPKQAERAASGFSKNRRGYAGVKPSANPFNQFEQNQYDFDQLEKEILSN